MIVLAKYICEWTGLVTTFYISNLGFQSEVKLFNYQLNSILLIEGKIEEQNFVKLSADGMKTSLRCQSHNQSINQLCWRLDERQYELIENWRCVISLVVSIDVA